MSVPSIDSQQFFRRASKIYEYWRSSNESENPFSSVECFLVAIGSNAGAFTKSTSLIIWLCNYELADILFLFTKNEICVFSSKKKINFFGQLSYDSKALPPLKFFTREKSEKDTDSVNEIINIMKKCKKSVGTFPKDTFSGDFIDSWNSVFTTCGLNTTDISPSISAIMANKEEIELEHITKACLGTSNLFDKLLKNKLIEIVDEEKKVKHSRIASMVEENITNAKIITDMSQDYVDICYSPIIQSGGNYTLKFSTSSSHANLEFDCIICSFGIRYKSYCSNIVRTVLVEPSPRLQNIYNCLLTAQQAIIDSLTDGVLLSAVYEAGLESVRSSMPEMISKLTTNFGFLTGIEFRESIMLICANSSARVTKSMVFSVNIGINNIEENVEGRTTNSALFVGDTVVVNESGPATVLTSQKKQIKNISIFIKNVSSGEENSDQKIDVDELFKKPSKRSVTLKNKNGTLSSTERDTKQKELAEKLNETASARLLNRNTTNLAKKEKLLSVKSYSSVSQMPAEAATVGISVDHNRSTLIVPIFGVPTPFHIATIKNISQSIEGGHTYLRINFNLTPSSSTPGDSLSFVREMTFRCSNVPKKGKFSAPSVNLNTVFRQIKEAQRIYKAKESEEREQEGIVTQDKIILSSGQNPRVYDVYVRPNILSKRTIGSLEAHTNGFRFTSSRGYKLDLMFSNIHKAFFQPAINEMIIVLHFVLKNSILVEKKKIGELQFYAEVGEIVSDLGKTSYSHDADELAAEQAEREQRSRMNTLFREFCDSVRRHSKKEIEFEIPIKDLGFFGNVFRGTSFFQPTVSCLVQLIDWPTFVLDLSTVEFAHFERVGDSIGKHFDLVFVLKDYSKKVIIVNAIPSTFIEAIKDWLTECEIRFTQGLQSLNWVQILKTATNDPHAFFQGGGWHFLDDEDDTSAQEDSTGDDSNFEESTESDSSSEDEEEDSIHTDEVAEESDELDSEEDSGQNWSELEEQAHRDDLRKHLDAMQAGRKRRMDSSSRPPTKRRR